MAELATVARPYERALYSLAAEKKKTAEWGKVLNLLAAISTDPKVEALISSPQLEFKAQAALLLKVLGEKKLAPELVSFVELLAENGRLALLPTVARQFQATILAEEHIAPAVIYSAYPIEAKELADLVKVIEKHCQVKLTAQLVVEPELIGGFRVEFGDQVLDMSVAGELSSLARTMIN